MAKIILWLGASHSIMNRATVPSQNTYRYFHTRIFDQLLVRTSWQVVISTKHIGHSLQIPSKELCLLMTDDWQCWKCLKLTEWMPVSTVTNLNSTYTSWIPEFMTNKNYYSRANWELTSSDAKQYQQKTCLQRLHIICAQPESRSMGTWHIGQRFTSESSVLLNGILKY